MPRSFLSLLLGLTLALPAFAVANTPAEADAFVADVIARWSEVVKAGNITPEE